MPRRLDGCYCGNTNQGRFSDAHAAAEEARDIDPFGKAVRLLCPRLMALHSEDARSQVHPITTRKNITNKRYFFCWPRGYSLRYIVVGNPKTIAQGQLINCILFSTCTYSLTTILLEEQNITMIMTQVSPLHVNSEPTR